MKGFPVNLKRDVAFSLVYNLKFVQRLMNHIEYVAALTSLSRRFSSVPSVWLELFVYCTEGTSGSLTMTQLVLTITLRVLSTRNESSDITALKGFGD